MVRQIQKKEDTDSSFLLGEIINLGKMRNIAKNTIYGLNTAKIRKFNTCRRDI